MVQLAIILSNFKGDKMISKKLLETVLNLEIRDFKKTHIYHSYNHNSDDYYELNGGEGIAFSYWRSQNPHISKHTTINIYELAHECKKWAYERGFMLESYIVCNHKYSICKIVDFDRNLIQSFQVKNSKKETSSIFKACEWILDNEK